MQHWKCLRMLPLVSLLSTQSPPPTWPVNTLLTTLPSCCLHFYLLIIKIFRITFTTLTLLNDHLQLSIKFNILSWNKIKYNNIFFYKIGACDIHTPLEYNIVLDVIYSSSSEFPWNRVGYASHILLSNSQVASSGLRCFHCTFTCPMVRFQSVISLLPRIQSDSTRNSPFGSTCTTF